MKTEQKTTYKFTRTEIESILLQKLQESGEIKNSAAVATMKDITKTLVLPGADLHDAFYTEGF